MKRLTETERKNILFLSDLLTNQIRKNIRYHDFTTLMAVGSSTYPDNYRTQLQEAVNDIEYEILQPKREKEIIEDRNLSFE